MYFEELYPLNEEHHVYVVRDTDDGRIYVKKILSVYDADIYHSLYEDPIIGLPRIISLSEDKAAGILIVVEEFIPGKTIEELMEGGRVFEEKETVGHITALCDILKQFHFRSTPIIHRDIKPSNVMITDDGRIILLDMNAGRFDKGEATRDTRLIGTGGYAAPEQYGFGSSGPYTDVYGVGMLMKAMLTGDVTLQTEYDGILKSVIQKCCAIDKQDRYPDVDQLMRALDSIALGSISPTAGSSQGIAEEQDSLEPASDKRAQKPHQGFLITVSAFTAVIVISGILLFILSQIKSGNIHPEGGYFPMHENEATGPELSEEVLDRICTSYRGKNGSGLTLKRDKSAVYYSNVNQYSEILCPWKYEDGVITVSLSKLHCDIAATVEDDDLSSLNFCADSKNWEDEEFIRLSKVNEKYEKMAIKPSNKLYYVNKNGCPEVKFSDMVFEIPKHYFCHPDAKKTDDSIIFVSNDVDQKEDRAVVFLYDVEDGFEVFYDNYKSAIKLFAAGFMDDPEFASEMELQGITSDREMLDQIASDKSDGENSDQTVLAQDDLAEYGKIDVSIGNIGEHKMYSALIEGTLNKGFGYLYDKNTLARVVFICDEKNGRILKIFMSDSRGDDSVPDISEADSIIDSMMLVEP